MILLKLLLIIYLVSFAVLYLFYGGFSYIVQDELIAHLKECEVIEGEEVDWLYHKRGGSIHLTYGYFLPLFPRYRFNFIIDGVVGGRLIPNDFNYLIKNKLNED